MNFFGGSNDVNGGCGQPQSNDCCSLIFLLLLLQNCGGFGCGKGCEITIDLNTIIWLVLLSSFGGGCGCGCNK